MRLPPALLLLSLPGCLSIRGPESVWGRERESLSVQCHYDSGWETSKKWWCRGAWWASCRILVETQGLEREEKGARVSIKDNQRNRSFTVTMQELRPDDADTYWCGIENPGANLGTQIKVTVGPSKSLLSTLRGPGAQDWKNEVPSPPLPEGRRERMVSESECEQDQGTDGWGGRGRDQGRASLPSPAAHRIPEVSLRPLQ
ncbi:CMRF35-like molecule 7 precursor [Bos taurus]|uniref:CD300LB protein n=1 Tax=Bos taurus TaxID=9913 RepID=A6QPS6_BOVIN|nr:CMRF35-like molecule 7 precursor [Bos taurus]AAI49464.1 CD300LB protein [Bos taurus]DAA18108.1 TPA: CD300 molecule-like family member b [Bos taurus]